MCMQYENPVPVQVTVRNTIFSGRGPNCPIYIGATSTLIADHNLFYLPQSEFLLTHGDAAYTCADIASLGAGNLCGDPLFLRPAWGADGDYHLREDSPAIDAGLPAAAPPDDLGGRPRDIRPDIGAWEWWRVVAWVHLPMVRKGS